MCCPVGGVVVVVDVVIPVVLAGRRLRCDISPGVIVILPNLTSAS